MTRAATLLVLLQRIYIYAVLVFLCLLIPYMLILYVCIAIYLFVARIPTYFLMLLDPVCGWFPDEATPHAPNTVSFYIVTVVQTVAIFPVLLVALMHILVVQVVACVAFGPVGFFTGVNVCENWRLVQTCTHYMGHSDCGCPLGLSRAFEFWRYVFGLYHRQHWCEWLLAPGFMIVFNPALKYIFTTNIWLWTLGEKYCNQWTKPFPGSDREVITEKIKTIVSDYKLRGSLERKVDDACFCAHYARPLPGSRAQCIGMQFAPEKLAVNLTMTTHQYLVEGAKPRSSTATDALWAVELHYWNSWHFLTGYVEVSLQDEAVDENALEHPMWIVVPSTGVFGHKLYEGVNKLFAKYSPQLHDSIHGEL